MSKSCFTNIDSFLYRLKTKDVYADVLQYKDSCNFSNFPDSHPCFQGMPPQAVKELENSNKKTIGKYKDEIGGTPILGFVGNDVVMKLKGIPKAIVPNQFTFIHYTNSLLDQSETDETQMKLFRSVNDHVTTVHQSKTSL